MSDCLEKCYIGHSMAGICKQTPCKLGNKNKKKKVSMRQSGLSKILL